MNKLLLPVAMALLLLSCQGSSFSVSDVNLEHNTRLTVSDSKVVSDNSYIVLSFESTKKDKYTYILRSPDGDISWEGSFSEKDGIYTSEDIYLSRFSSFECGEYEYFIYSENGQEKNGKVSLGYSSFSGPFFSEDGMLEIVGLSVDKTEEEKRVEGHDSYGNSVVLERIETPVKEESASEMQVIEASSAESSEPEKAINEEIVDPTLSFPPSFLDLPHQE
ncbi:MAG: hypothetical protein K6G51_02855 [Sphaerochaetaceae bacterium]|nr:hypothetical protein [Sphaerochaetaceae bacterium]